MHLSLAQAATLIVEYGSTPAPGVDPEPTSIESRSRRLVFGLKYHNVETKTALTSLATSLLADTAGLDFHYEENTQTLVELIKSLINSKYFPPNFPSR